jgi:hypothetical protein
MGRRPKNYQLEKKSILDALEKLYRLGIPPSLLLRGVGLESGHSLAAQFRRDTQEEVSWEHFPHCIVLTHLFAEI